MSKLSLTKTVNYLLLQTVLLAILLTVTDLSFLLIADHSETELSVGVTLLSNLSFNFLFSIITVAILSLPYILISRLNSTLAKVIISAVIVLILISNAALDHYSNQTHLSLGSDLFGYSLSEILFIAGSSTDVSFSLIFLFLAIPVAFLLLNRLKWEEKFNTLWLIIPVILGAGLSLIFYPNFRETSRLSYFLNDGWALWQDRSSQTPQNWDSQNEYPLMRPFNAEDDVLGANLELHSTKPNIVILVVEGLGSDFTGENAQYTGFTPFLDSLSKHSLYWSNFLSNTGRSFGALPSILGSAPFGQQGFLELDELPDHISLISLLKKNGYYTSYFEGGQSSFDKKNRYLNNEGIDQMTDQNSFDNTYQKTAETDKGFSWGYPDSEIYRKTLTSLYEGEKPRLDIIMSISNHEPFQFPEKEKYVRKLEELLSTSALPASKKRTIEKNPEVFASLLYTDESIRNLMDGFKNRPDFQNTIFIITGDHRLIPIPQKDVICRYHVPLMIYSPMQRQAREFKGLSSHMDITPSLGNMLFHAYAIQTPEEVPWIGTGLSSSHTFVAKKEIPLMKYKGSFADFISGDTYLSDGKFFSISDGLGLQEASNPELLTEVKEKYKLTKNAFQYATLQNKIIPAGLKMNDSKLVKFTAEEQRRIDQLCKGLDEGQIFFMARDSAHHKHYDIALLLLDHLNNLNFNHFDGRTLRGRIYGWTDRYEEAEKELKLVIDRSPLYSDAYSALLDLYWWNSKGPKAKKIAALAEKYFAENRTFIKSVNEKMDRFSPEELRDDLTSTDQLNLSTL